MTATVTRAQARALTVEVEAAVRAVLTHHGFEVGVTRTTFGDMYAFKVEAIPAGATKPEERNWTELANFYGLPADGLGKTITLAGRTFEVVGLNTRAPKSPVMLKDPLTGKSFKAGVPAVSAALLRA